MKLFKTMFLVAVVAVLYACGSGEKKAVEETDTVVEEETTVVEEKKVTASAQLSSANESGVSGEALFTDLGNGAVKFNIMIMDATPGAHAVHLHENGDCSAPDATSAGGHWNPTNVKHGQRGVDAHQHSGDIANIMVGENGVGTMEMIVEGWSIGGSDSTSVINKAVIIHASADDFVSQPAGAAGKRVACGVIAQN